MEAEKKLNIYQRVNKVREDVAYLKKDKKVESYWAVTHDMVTSEVRPFLIKYGIVMVVRQTSYKIQDTGKSTKKNTPITRYCGMYDIDFVNMDDPEDKFTSAFGAIAEDHGDKAPGKCASYAIKTAMLKEFNIETGESDESRIEDKPTPIKDTDIITLRELCEAKDFYGKDADDKLKSLAERVYQKKKIEDLPVKDLQDAIERLTTMPKFEKT